MTFDEFVAGRAADLLRFAVVLSGRRASAERLVVYALERTLGGRTAIDDPALTFAEARVWIVRGYLSEGMQLGAGPAADVDRPIVDATEADSDWDDLTARFVTSSKLQRTLTALIYYAGLDVDATASVMGSTSEGIALYLRRVHHDLNVRADDGAEVAGANSEADVRDLLEMYAEDVDPDITALVEALHERLPDGEAERVEAERVEAERVEAERVDAERLAAERLEAERVEAERLEAERVEAERAEAERLEAERAEAERLEAERLEAERVEAQRAEAERAETERLEVERAEAERLEAERLEAERVEAERAEAERAETERLETERAETERLETERAETERLETERAEAQRAEAERLEAQRAEAERLDAERAEAERLETERLEEERAEAERRDAVRREVDRIENERLEAERLEAEEAEAVRRESVRREVERVETERRGTEREEPELARAQRADAKRQKRAERERIAQEKREGRAAKIAKREQQRLARAEEKRRVRAQRKGARRAPSTSRAESEAPRRSDQAGEGERDSEPEAAAASDRDHDVVELDAFFESDRPNFADDAEEEADANDPPTPGEVGTATGSQDPLPAPEDSAPEDSAPEDSAPEDSAPEDSAPEDSAPEDSAPEDSAPEDSASEHAEPGLVDVSTSRAGRRARLEPPANSFRAQAGEPDHQPVDVKPARSSRKRKSTQKRDRDDGSGLRIVLIAGALVATGLVAAGVLVWAGDKGQAGNSDTVISGRNVGLSSPVLSPLPGTHELGQYAGIGSLIVATGHKSVPAGRTLIISVVCRGKGPVQVGALALPDCKAPVNVAADRSGLRSLDVTAPQDTRWRIALTDQPNPATNGALTSPPDAILDDPNAPEVVGVGASAGTATVNLRRPDDAETHALRIALTCSGTGVTIRSATAALNGKYTRSCFDGWSYQFDVPDAPLPATFTVLAAMNTAWRLVVVTV